MDEVSRAFHDMAFKVAFMEKKADEFQDFFASIMEKRYPGDFIRSRPWGRRGDRKSDGYLVSKRMLFAVYAPNDMTAAKCVAKINADFTGALPHWKKHFDTWVFVHNSRAGLGPEQTAKLLELRMTHPPLALVSWGFEELRLEALQLSAGDLASLLGPAPSRRNVIGLGLESLSPVLDHIARLQPSPNPDLRPVSAGKIEYNQLSQAVDTLLKAGMSREDVVRRYFKRDPLLQDRIATSFRQQYAKLRAGGANPDDVFVGLQQYASGNLIVSAGHQSAVLAVLAFFFNECDIFERPGWQEGGPQ